MPTRNGYEGRHVQASTPGSFQHEKKKKKKENKKKENKTNWGKKNVARRITTQSMETSRRNLPNSAVFVSFASLVLDKNGLRNQSQGVCYGASS